MKTLRYIVLLSAITTTVLLAGRGGGGGGRGFSEGRSFSEGGFTDRVNEGSLYRDNSNVDWNASRNFNNGVQTDNFNASDNNRNISGSVTSNGNVEHANISGTTQNGNTFNASATKVNNQAFDGYRTGFYYHNGVYNPVNLIPYMGYVAPEGLYAGWSIITQPGYIDYPAYATCPVETAVQIQLAKLGYYDGDIDGNIDSVAQAISAYQQQNQMPVTGTITGELLTKLGISCTMPSN